VKLDFGMGAMGAKCIWSNSSAAGMAFDQPLEALPDLDVKQIIEQKEAA
jgi:hypothetical protein